LKQRVIQFTIPKFITISRHLNLILLSLPFLSDSNSWFFLGKRQFPLTEIHALDMQQGRHKINEKETDDSAVDVDDVCDTDVLNSHQEANAYR
jgi:hypothetical protein